MSKSINVLFGKELIEIGYKKLTVNHFEKKYGNYIFYVDRDLGEFLLLRLMAINEIKKTKCILSKFIKDFASFSQNDFISLILETENDDKNLINNNNH
jgi:hypothetical protein